MVMPAAPPQAPPTGAGDDGGLVTRFLCSVVYLRDNVASTINREILKQPFRAISPCWGVNMRAVGRHTVQSLRERKRLDDVLLLWLAIAIAVIVAIPWLAPNTGFGGVLAIRLAVVLVLIVIAAVRVYAFYHRMRDYARAVMAFGVDDEELLALAPELDDFNERTLGELEDANVVTYRHGYPFIGSGRMLTSWTLRIDPTNSANWPVPDDLPNLHAHLEVKVSERGDGTLTAGQWLHVHGPSVPLVGELQPDGADVPQKPAVQVSDETLAYYISTPHPDRRVYVRFQQTGWGRHLVVSLMVRCSLDGDTLVVEGAICSLLPLTGDMLVARDLTTSVIMERIQVGRKMLNRTIPLLVGCPARVFTRILNGRRHTRMVQLQAEDIQVGIPPFNFGADTSIRETFADRDRIWFEATRDERAHAQVLQSRVFDALVGWLQERKVDVSTLVNDQMWPIIGSWATSYNVNPSSPINPGGHPVDYGDD
jgi:hypothetical protein